MDNNQGFPGGPLVKNLLVSAGDMGSIPGLGGSRVPRTAKPLCHSCWAWELQLPKPTRPRARAPQQDKPPQGEPWAPQEMAAHSNTLAWKIPWTEEPGGLQSLGSRRVRHDWALKHLTHDGMMRKDFQILWRKASPEARRSETENIKHQLIRPGGRS